MKYTREDIRYPGMYPDLDDDKIEIILKHCDYHKIEPDICAYYEDWEDFCSDWCDYIGLTEEEAREKLNGGDFEGEFIDFGDWGIIRFVW